MTSINNWNAAATSPFAAECREGYGNGRRRRVAHSTPLSIWETNEKIRIEIDLPGVNAEALDLNFKEGMLWILGERRFSEGDGQLRFNDRWFGPFERVVKLPAQIDPNSIDAELNNGVLLVTLTKKPEAQPHKVKVHAAR